MTATHPFTPISEERKKRRALYWAEIKDGCFYPLRKVHSWGTFAISSTKLICIECCPEMGHRKFHPQILVDVANDEPAHLTFPANFEILRLLAQAGVGLPSKQHICPFRTAGSHHSYSSLLSLLLGSPLWLLLPLILKTCSRYTTTTTTIYIFSHERSHLPHIMGHWRKPRNHFDWWFIRGPKRGS